MQDLAPGSDEVADRQEAPKWDGLAGFTKCRLCGKQPQVLVLESTVKIACPTGCKIIEAPTLNDAEYIWNERWHNPRP